MPGMLPPASAENVGTGRLPRAIRVNVTTPSLLLFAARFIRRKGSRCS
jgi:hypothetical protein